jgi:Pyruvate/2-oxoacid:ferredoxin oxidoreductase gamma subunit
MNEIRRVSGSSNALVVRFAGDSGDGMQLTGSRFTQEAALGRADLATFPDFPAEIRAPVGTTFGVSAFQIQFGGRRVRTPGDQLDVLVALNPAALKVNLADLRRGGTLIVDTAAFVDRNLKKAGYEANPLEGQALDNYRVMPIDITKLTQAAVKPLGVGNRDANRARNFWTLGLALWLTGHERDVTRAWIKERFAKDALTRTHLAALDAGHAMARRWSCHGCPRYCGQARRPPAARPLPHRDRRRGPGLGLITGGSSPASSSSTAPTRSRRPRVSCMSGAARASGFALPGRGRDRGHLRCLGASYAGKLADRQLRPRHRAQDRGARPRDRDRASAHRHRRAAGRPSTACRPRPSSRTSSRRSSAATQMRRSWCWRPPPRGIAFLWRSRPSGSRPGT